MEHLSVVELASTKGNILQLQAAGNPIRKILLLESAHAAMAEMREIIEIAVYDIALSSTLGW